MKRFLAPLVALLFAVVLLAPSIVLLEFHLDRARIERELCVQRESIEDMRTCHGECQLSKRFKALEQEAEAGFPAERIQTRYEPQISVEVRSSTFMLVKTDRIFPPMSVPLLQGVRSCADPVPRG